VLDWDLLNKLTNKCGGAFVRETGKALAESLIRFVMSEAWRRYRGAVITGKDPAVGYGQAVAAVWHVWSKANFFLCAPRGAACWRRGLK
jgi:hypothetical protein